MQQTAAKRCLTAAEGLGRGLCPGIGATVGGDGLGQGVGDGRAALTKGLCKGIGVGVGLLQAATCAAPSACINDIELAKCDASTVPSALHMVQEQMWMHARCCCSQNRSRQRAVTTQKAGPHHWRWLRRMPGRWHSRHWRRPQPGHWPGLGRCHRWLAHWPERWRWPALCCPAGTG